MNSRRRWVSGAIGVVVLISFCVTGGTAVASPDSETLLSLSTSVAMTVGSNSSITPAVGISARPVDWITADLALAYPWDLEHGPGGNLLLSLTGLWWIGGDRDHLILGGQVGIEVGEISLGLPGLRIVPLVGYGLRLESFELRFAWSPTLYWLRPKCGAGCSDKLFFEPMAVMVQAALPIW